jgi:hypothetical protein
MHFEVLRMSSCPDYSPEEIRDNTHRGDLQHPFISEIRFWVSIRGTCCC